MQHFNSFVNNRSPNFNPRLLLCVCFFLSLLTYFSNLYPQCGLNPMPPRWRVTHSFNWASQVPQIIIVMPRFDPSLVFICTIMWILQQLETSWTVMEEPKQVFPLKASYLFNVLRNPPQEILAQWSDDSLYIYLDSTIHTPHLQLHYIPCIPAGMYTLLYTYHFIPPPPQCMPKIQ